MRLLFGGRDEREGGKVLLFEEAVECDSAACVPQTEDWIIIVIECVGEKELRPRGGRRSAVEEERGGGDDFPDASKRGQED